VLPPEHPPAVPADWGAIDPMVWPRGAARAGGALTVGGADVRDLAAEFGTPLFVLDEEDFRGRCRDFRQAFGDEAGVYYAAKAFCCRAVLRWVAEEGLGVDVCTGGELEVALAAGVDPAMITLHGSNKLLPELERAVSVGVGHIVVDSFEEIARLAYITGERAHTGDGRAAFPHRLADLRHSRVRGGGTPGAPPGGGGQG
jgi:diaminopimelate decarboxylase